jgi:hypothetical protein
MAKAKDLAVLAGLAGLGYMMSKKGDKKETDTSGDSNPTRAARPESTETREEPRRQITDYMKKAPSNDTDKPAPKLDTEINKPVKSASVADSISNSDRRDLEAGMSRGTRPAPASTNTVSSSEEGMKNYKPRRTSAASTTSSSAEGMKNYVPRSTPPSATKNAPSASAKPATPPASSSRVPTSEQAAANRQALYDKVKSVASNVKFETPADARSRRAAEASGMKRGGSVKMASGGMTASRRGDGIATKGKTRGKIC